MDVRCERCSTEYELDDDSVPDAGCPVQCTTCSHTFMVTRRGVAAATAPPETLPSPPAAEWLLETSDGRLHRFRNLTSLQKWIIERKVTREDKISRTGQSWRRLGEIVELAPFFDVVDEADCARAGQAGNDELKAEAQRARNLGSASRASPVPARSAAPSPAPGSLPRSAATPLPPRPAPPPRVATPPRPMPPPSNELAALDAWASQGADASGFDADYETSVVPRSRMGIKAVLAFALAAAVGAAAFVLYQRQVERKPSPLVTEESLARLAPPEEVSLPPSTVASPPPAAVPTPALPAPDPSPAPAPAAPTVVASAPNPAAASKAAPASDDPGPGYERSLAEADRLLENGATEKAFKLYEKALKMRPDGAEALAGLGYVMLDKERAGPAVSYFEKALAQAPNFGPAVFGMGEALRAGGQDSRALEMYQRYLRINSGGVDAPAARRQASALEDKLKSKAGREGSAGAGSETIVPPSGPPPTGSSVLNEPAAP